jgi:protein gp37
MFFLDALRNKNGADIYKTANFDYPLQRKRDGSWKIQSGEMIRVCMTSDFFLEEADEWRDQAWEIMRQRPDVKFFLLTKRPERVAEHLPKDWNGGWENIMLNVTCENQKRADERIPLLFSLPFKHKGIMCAPFLEEIHIEKYLEKGIIEQVLCGGENYGGARICDFDWVKSLQQQCKETDTTFCFIETGTKFVKDKKLYHLQGKPLQSRMAYKSGMNYQGRKKEWILKDPLGFVLEKEDLYVPYFGKQCRMCASRMFCNGCARCAKCSCKEEQTCGCRQKTGSAAGKER